MSELFGKLQDNLGWLESQAFVDDPDNAKIPDRSRNEFVIGMTSFVHSSLKDVLDGVTSIIVDQDALETAV